MKKVVMILKEDGDDNLNTNVVKITSQLIEMYDFTIPPIETWLRLSLTRKLTGLGFTRVEMD